MVKEMLTIRERELSLKIVNATISSVRSKDVTKKGARAFKDGKIMLASFVGDIPDDRLYRSCREMEDLGIPYSYRITGNTRHSESLSARSEIDAGMLYERANDALAHLRSVNDRFIYSGSIEKSLVSEHLRNTNGVDCRIDYEVSKFVCMFKHRDTKNILDGFLHYVSLFDEDFEYSIDRNAELLNAFEKEETIGNGLRKVLFLSPTPLFSKLSESLMIDKYMDDSALFSGRVGERLFNENFSLYDVNYDPEHIIFDPFDGEGTMRDAHEYPLIEKGVFTNCICDLQNATRYDSTTTGNGKRAFNSHVVLGFNTLVARGGERPLDDLLGDIDEAILVIMAQGGDFIDNGDFSTPVQLSYLVKNGKVKGRLPQLTVKSSVGDMFGDRLVAISSDGFYRFSANPCMIFEMEVFNC